METVLKFAFFSPLNIAGFSASIFEAGELFDMLR